MLALISQSPPGTYDLILSDGEFVKLLKEAGYIEAMDPNEYNMGDLCSMSMLILTRTGWATRCIPS